MVGKDFSGKDKKYLVKSYLGKGKSGYSYLIENNGQECVLKLMHDEICTYYSFSGNKVESEVKAYEQLKKIGIDVPDLMEYDFEKNYLIKEYCDGIVASEMIAKGQIKEEIISKLFEISKKTIQNNINIDYFPANFVIENNNLIYIDYEVNRYTKEWDLTHWGIFYWANNEGMKKYLETGDILMINESVDSGIPIKKPFIDKVEDWISKYN